MKTKIKKSQRLVLVGGGHAHVGVLKRWAMEGLLEHVEIILVSPQSHTFYSGMLPGLVARQYEQDDLCIDLEPLCQMAGAFFVRDYCTGLDPVKQEIFLKNSGNIYYDYVSFDIGSQANLIPGFNTLDPRMMATRPFQTLLDKLQYWDQKIAKEQIIGVIGGGAAALEMAHALAQRYPSAKLKLFHDKPLAHTWKKFSKIETIEGIRIESVVAQEPYLELASSKQTFKVEYLLLASGAAPVDIFEELSLGGYLEVTASLNTPVFSNVFGAGDCIHFRPTKGLPKAGVYPVRETETLYENLRMSVHGRYDYTEYTPQKNFLKLLNLCDGRAILEYGPISICGAWAWKWKDYIDRKFMKMFAPSTNMPVETDCGACGCKLSADELSAGLEAISIRESTRDDVAIVDFPGGTFAWTIDFFKNSGFDPFVLGQAAAHAANSDIYAKGLVPEAALSMVSLLPRERKLQENFFSRLMLGAEKVFSEESIKLIGGQTIVGDGDAIGFSVLAQKSKIFFPKQGAKPGDALILTKALGTGTILSAAMQGLARGEQVEACLDNLNRSQAGVSSILREFALQNSDAIHAVTDITGFGLWGHLREMCGPNLGITIELEKIPFLPGAKELHTRGVRSRMLKLNQRSFPDTNCPSDLLYSPETNGGLLIAVSENFSSTLLQQLQKQSLAQLIGHIRACFQS